ncbi:MAG: CoA transferase [Alphaproteobacteria bacterium]|nr:CoA transferase [Alphaproteobacteria bacterium]MBL6938374.1 CoA transferase [Alphaproteobacteria bacterium]MBL7096433.1 CoA transferase [Alphaproteobacteria bacterium]
MKLTGVRVLDLSQFLPGPHLTMTMADHGADVIMVEPKNGIGEPTRRMGTVAKDGERVWFRNIARGKRSVVLDLKNKDDLDTFLKLADEADVIVEAFRPGVVKRLGIGYEAVAARNPRIVYCSISAFGQNSPYRDKPSHDLGVQAMAGTLDLSRGFADDKPNMPNLVAADMASSLTALSAILMALLAREKAGRGDYIDIAMYDSLIAWTPNITGAVFGEDAAPVPRLMRNYGGQAMNRIYETTDGRFVVLAGNERKFCENLLTALGRPDLVDLAAGEPGDSQKPLIDFFTRTFALRTRAEWEIFLEPIDLCWGAVRSLKEGFHDRHSMERGMLLHDRQGNPHIGPAIRFAGDPAQPQFDLPSYGAGAAAWRAR